MQRLDKMQKNHRLVHVNQLDINELMFPYRAPNNFLDH